MSEQAGEKTELPSQKRLEEAAKRGQIARSPEVQTVFVLLAGLGALKFIGPEIWRQLAGAQVNVLGHLHEIPLSLNSMQGYALAGAKVAAACVLPLLVCTFAGGLAAGFLQNRFQISSEAIEPKWERLDPIAGFKRIFSIHSLTPTALGVIKLLVIIALSYSQVNRILTDPIFYSSINVARIAGFLADASFSIVLHVVIALVFLAAIDYGYQLWKTQQDLMMTKQEVKDETKNSEGDPQVKARMRRRRNVKTMRQMLQEVPQADVIVTNPTHIAVALRYDRKTMKAPKIVAKGTRLNALKIREIAGRYQVPIVENKPLARLMFRYGKVGGEVPAELYAAVAEVLAWVYRANRYRYYAENNQT